MKQTIALLAICCLLLITVACSSLEKQAYNTIVGAKAFLDAEKKVHPECAAGGTTSSLCSNLARATSAKDALIDATEVYCSGVSFDSGGVCQPPAKGTPALAQATVKLKAAIAAYNQTEKDVRGAI